MKVKKPLLLIFGIFFLSLLLNSISAPRAVGQSSAPSRTVVVGGSNSPSATNVQKTPLTLGSSGFSLNDLLNHIPSQLKDPSLLILIVVAFLGWLFLFKDGGKPNNKKMATAQWAGTKEKGNALRKAKKQIKERKHDALTLWINTPLRNGEYVSLKPEAKRNFKPNSDTIVIPDCQRGTMVIGAPGTGKTFSYIDAVSRSAVEQGVPIVLYDFKFGSPGSQAEMLSGWAKAHGYKIILFAPGFEGSMKCNLLDFLANAEDADTAGQIASTLTANFTNSGGTDDPFFKKSGDQLVKAVLQLAKATSQPDLLTCQKILAMPPAELAEKIKASPHVSPWIKISWDQFMSMKDSEKTVASVVSTAALMFVNFMTPDILPTVSGKSDLPMEISGKTLVIFGMDKDRRDVVGPILATVMHMLITKNLNKRREDPLLVVADEFPTIILPSMTNWLNEGRGLGFCGLIGMQTISQAEKAYGKDNTQALMTGCNTKIIFNPGTTESAKIFSEFLGKQHIDYKQRSKSNAKGGSSTSISDQERTNELFSADEILRMPTGKCIILNPGYGNDDQANIPHILKIKLSRKELKNIEIAQATSVKLLRKLAKDFPKGKIDITDLESRERAIEEILQPSEKPLHTESTSSSIITAVSQNVLQDGSLSMNESTGSNETEIDCDNSLNEIDEFITEYVQCSTSNEQAYNDYIWNNAINHLDKFDAENAAKINHNSLDDFNLSDLALPELLDETELAQNTLLVSIDTPDPQNVPVQLDDCSIPIPF
jgi:type IV secretory pathway TraG/TraD family ATPase VirD4